MLKGPLLATSGLYLLWRRMSARNPKRTSGVDLQMRCIENQCLPYKRRAMNVSDRTVGDRPHGGPGGVAEGVEGYQPRCRPAQHEGAVNRRREALAPQVISCRHPGLAVFATRYPNIL